LRQGSKIRIGDQDRHHIMFFHSET
jgi:hypothetical protein